MIQQTIAPPDPGLFEWAGLMIPVVVAIIGGVFTMWWYRKPPNS